MDFRTKFNRVEIFSAPGSPIKEDYIGEYDNNGEIVLTKTGEHNWYDEIQSYRSGCDLQIILKRFLDGDQSALARRQGMFGDFTQMPKTYMDMLNMSLRAEDMFAKLPIEVKQRFDNNFALWLSSVNSDDWYRKMGFTPKESQIKSENSDSKKEVNSNE